MNRGHPIRAARPACKRAARPARREMTSSSQDLFFSFPPTGAGMWASVALCLLGALKLVALRPSSRRLLSVPWAQARPHRH